MPTTPTQPTTPDPASADSLPRLDSTDLIYYLTTDIPHLHDFTFFGPFPAPTPEIILPTISHKLPAASLPLLRNLIPTWSTSGQHSTTLPLASGHSIILTLKKFKNPTVAAALPCPAWTVAQHRLNVAGLQESWKIWGVYLGLEDANEAARKAMDEKVKWGSWLRDECVKEDGGLCLAAVDKEGRGGRWIVEVS